MIESGAIGVSIRVAGKVAGSERSRFQKFRKGFVAYSGDYAEKLVERGFAQALLKPGMVGIQVRIMKEAPKEFEMRELPEEKEFKPQKLEENKEEAVGSTESKTTERNEA